MDLQSGKIVQWENPNKQKIVWMICDDITKGVVIHSDNLVQVGTITNDIESYSPTPFVGTVNIVSSEN